MTVPSSKSVWFSNYRPNPRAQLRLFCLPYAGGGASLFRKWSELLSPAIEVLPIQLPGRENRLSQVPFSQMQLLLAALEQELLPYLEKPYALFGYSMGALLSFELARSLRRHGLPEPAHLCIAAHRAPQLSNRFPPIHHLPEGEFLKTIGGLAGTPEEMLHNPEVMEVYLPILRADFALCENYVYSDEAPLQALISALGGVTDDKVTRKELEAWKIQTRGQFLLQMIPGNHFFLHTGEAQVMYTLSRILHWLIEQ